MNYNEYYNDFLPLELSDFQKESIKAIVDGNHSLVAAPTGSGKSLPMEFVTNYFTKKNKKVIICNPIKSLSNQRYYDFTNKFNHLQIGLMTGDIKTNPTADVIIMTTEVLMNYLFNKKTTDIDIDNELGAVVFDESHYINDKDRGKNWEQCLMLLPSHIQLLLLSATLDNPKKLANFLENRYTCANPKKVIISVSTLRNVPLLHYSYITVTEKMFNKVNKEVEKDIRNTTNKLLLIQNEKNIFQDKTYYSIKKNVEFFHSRRNVIIKRKFVLNNLFIDLKQTNKLPAICFIFSRKIVEITAKEITTNLLEDDSKIPYETKFYCDSIIRKLPNYNEYLNLPEYNELVMLLEKGIGIHHSGMIPILREIVELLICEKKIKVLFATETFAIGLNCPIKTVIFTSLTKFDGNNMRYLLSHEYTQAAGRAGRRGIDPVGSVIHLNNLFNLPTIIDYKKIISTTPQILTSKMYISYSVILKIIMNFNQEKNKDKEIKNFLEPDSEVEPIDISIFIDFFKKTMIYNEYIENIEKQKKYLLSFNKQLLSKKNYASLNFKTPILILENYIENKNSKQRKKLEEEHFYLKKEIIIMNEIKELELLYEKELNYMIYLENYLENQINNVLSVLKKYNLIDDKFNLTNSGLIASNVMELHPLLIPFMLKKWNNFNDISPVELVEIFSCFTNVNLVNENKVNNNLVIESIIVFFDEICDIENNHYMITGEHSKTELNYNLMDEVTEWCKCDNEEKCKYFIQTYLNEKEILLGDFSKAILKINVIIKELINIAELTNNIELLYKLNKIEPLLLKFIFTSQSLYL